MTEAPKCYGNKQQLVIATHTLLSKENFLWSEKSLRFTFMNYEALWSMSVMSSKTVILNLFQTVTPCYKWKEFEDSPLAIKNGMLVITCLSPVCDLQIQNPDPGLKC